MFEQARGDGILWRRWAGAVALVAVATTAALSPGGVNAQSAGGSPVDVALARVGARVQRYFETAQSVVSTETVLIQPLSRSFAPEGRPRRLVYELRLAWEAPREGSVPEASVVRRLLTADGRAAKPGDEPGCLDPQPVTPEPLAMLLPTRRGEYAFTVGRRSRVGAREVTVVNYRALARGEPEVRWTGDCVHVSVAGRTRGRLWVDAATDDVVRLEEQLVGPVVIPVPREHAGPGDVREMRIERADTSIRYAAVDFREPDETLLLPSRIETLSVFTGSGVPRLRTVQTFSGYRRFLAESRLLQ